MSLSQSTPGLAVDLLELVVGLEGAVVVGRLAPRDVGRGRDVARALGLLLRQVGRGEQPAGELVGAADVDQVLDADRLDGLVAERADRVVLLLRGVRRALAGGQLVGQLAGVELPLLASAVEQLHVLVAVQLEVPVGVGGEPVVVAAVEHDRVVVGDAAVGEERLELRLVHEVAADLVLEVGRPVELDGALDVALVVGRGVLVDLDQDDARGVEVVRHPLGGDERVVAGHVWCLSVGGDDGDCHARRRLSRTRHDG